MKKISKKMVPICAALLGIQIVLGGCAKNSTDIQTAKVNARQAAETEVKTTVEETTSGEITTAEETSGCEAAAKENMGEKEPETEENEETKSKTEKESETEESTEPKSEPEPDTESGSSATVLLQEIYVWRRMDLYWIIMMKWDRILRHVCHPIY